MGGGGGLGSPPSPCVTFRLVAALDSHPFFPSHVASVRCFLSAAAAGAPAGVISAFAEPSGWCAGVVLGVGGVVFAHTSVLMWSLAGTKTKQNPWGGGGYCANPAELTCSVRFLRTTKKLIKSRPAMNHTRRDTALTLSTSLKFKRVFLSICMPYESTYHIYLPLSFPNIGGSGPRKTPRRAIPFQRSRYSKASGFSGPICMGVGGGINVALQCRRNEA